MTTERLKRYFLCIVLLLVYLYGVLSSDYYVYYLYLISDDTFSAMYCASLWLYCTSLYCTVLSLYCNRTHCNVRMSRWIGYCWVGEGTWNWAFQKSAVWRGWRSSLRIQVCVCVYRYWYSFVRRESVILSDPSSMLIWIAICTAQCIGLQCIGWCWVVL